MSKINNSLILGFVLLSSQSLIIANNETAINEVDRYIKVPVNIEVNDTVKIVNVIDSVRAVRLAQKAKHVELLNVISDRRSIASNYLSNSDGKIKDKNAIQILDSIFGMINLCQPGTNWIEKIDASEIYINPVYKRSKKDELTEVKFEDILKDVKKGKFSPNVYDCLKQIHEISDSQLSFLEKKKREYDSEISKLSNGDLEYAFQSATGSYRLPKKEITVYKQEKNNWYRDPNSSNKDLDYKLQTKGWEWARDLESLLSDEEFYPVEIKYYYSQQFPDIRLLNVWCQNNEGFDCAFDTSGNLMRVLYFDSDDIYEKISKDYLNKQLIADYRNNKYNVLSESAEVKKDIETMLGLRKEKQNSGDNFNKKLISLDRQYRSTTNKKKRQALIQQGVGLFLNEIAATQKETNHKASSFIKQCKADHENELGHVWKVSRMGNNHFNIEFINPDTKTTHNFILLFKSTKPYGGLEYSINETSSNN